MVFPCRKFKAGFITRPIYKLGLKGWYYLFHTFFTNDKYPDMISQTMYVYNASVLIILTAHDIFVIIEYA